MWRGPGASDGPIQSDAGRAGSATGPPAAAGATLGVAPVASCAVDRFPSFPATNLRLAEGARGEAFALGRKFGDPSGPAIGGASSLWAAAAAVATRTSSGFGGGRTIGGGGGGVGELARSLSSGATPSFGVRGDTLDAPPVYGRATGMRAAGALYRAPTGYGGAPVGAAFHLGATVAHLLPAAAASAAAAKEVPCGTARRLFTVSSAFGAGDKFVPRRLVTLGAPVLVAAAAVLAAQRAFICASGSGGNTPGPAVARGAGPGVQRRDGATAVRAAALARLTTTDARLLRARIQAAENEREASNLRATVRGACRAR